MPHMFFPYFILYIINATKLFNSYEAGSACTSGCCVMYIFFWVIECEPLNSHEMYGEIESE